MSKDPAFSGLKEELVGFLIETNLVNTKEHTYAEAADILYEWLGEEYDRQLDLGLNGVKL